MRNDSSVDVLGVGMYKLIMRGGHTSYLHDILYAPGIQHNLFSILAMLQLGFSFSFEISLGTIYLWYRFSLAIKGFKLCHRHGDCIVPVSCWHGTARWIRFVPMDT